MNGMSTNAAHSRTDIIVYSAFLINAAYQVPGYRKLTRAVNVLWL